MRSSTEAPPASPSPAASDPAKASWKAVGLGIAISVIAVVVLLWRVRFRDLGTALATADLAWFAPALAVFVVMFALRAWRWSVLMGGTPLAATWHANLIGYFFNITLPLRLGEIARAYVISKNGGVTMTRALAAVLVERLIDLASVLLLFAWFAQRVPMRAAFTRAATLGGVLVVIGVLAAIVVVVKGAALERVAAPRLARFGERRAAAWLGRSRQLREALAAVGSPKRIAQALALTVLVWAATIVVASLCLRAFFPGGSDDVTRSGLVVVMANLGGALPSAPAGLGVVQGFATSALVVPFNVDESRALAFVLVWTLGQQLVLLVLGFVSIGRVGLSFREIRAAAAQPAARIDPASTAD